MTPNRLVGTRHLVRVLAARFQGTPCEPPTAEQMWDLIVAAVTHKVPALLSLALRDAGVAVAEPFAHELRRHAHRTAASNVAAMAELQRVADGLRRAGVPMLVLKGMALTLGLYRRPDVRHMTDIDLLIQPAHAATTERVLLGLGCRRGPTPLREDFYPQYYYEREYRSPGGLRLDVHARPLRPLRYGRTMPGDALWESPVTVGHGDLEVRCPAPPDQFIHLAAHSAIHGDARLLWSYDLLAFAHAHADGAAFDRLGATARRWGLTTAVRQGLDAAATLFDDDILRGLAATLSDPPTWTDSLVLRQAPRDARHPVAHIMTNLVTTPGWRYRLGYLQALMRPDDHHLEALYPHRHFGWRWCAQSCRLTRGLLRPLGVGATPTLETRSP